MNTIAKKICLVGVYGVGKTSLISRFVRQTFSEKYLTTLGVKIDTKLIAIDDSKECKLVIWDIAGKEEYSSTDEKYLKGAAGCLLVVDGTRRKSAETVLNLKQQLNELIGDVPCVCAINKSDLQEEWQITNEDIENLNSSVEYVFNTSAASGDNVEIAFSKLAEIICAA